MAFAFLVDPLRHGPLIPFIVGGLAALLALFIAAATLVARLIAGRDRRLALVLVLPATWTVGGVAARLGADRLPVESRRLWSGPAPTR